MIKPTTSRAYHVIGSGLPPAEMWISKSLLWKFMESPYIWKRKYDRGDVFQPTKATDWGSSVDVLITSPQEKLEAFAIGNFTSYRTDAAKAFRDQARLDEKIPFLQCKMPELEEAAGVLRDFLRSQGWYGVDTQMQVQMTHAIVIDGRKYNLKGLADLLRDKVEISDIKTTGAGLDDRSLRNTIADRGYHVQAALYLDLLSANNVSNPDAFPLFFQEQQWPYRCIRVNLDEIDIAKGRAWYQQAIQAWHHAVTTDTWPGAVLPTLEGGLPPWAKGGRDV